MENSKKRIYTLIAVISLILLISPVDILPGMHVDDVGYLIAGIAGLIASRNVPAADDDVYYEYQD